jgi:hypothetical protein
LVKLAPEPAPIPAAAVQALPLVQVIESPPLASTFEAEVESTLPKAIALVETVQLAVTVALVASVPLAVPATAAAGRQKAATAMARLRVVVLDILVFLTCYEGALALLAFPVGRVGDLPAPCGFYGIRVKIDLRTIAAQ